MTITVSKATPQRETIDGVTPLRARRLDHSLRLQDVSNYTGINMGTLSRIERGDDCKLHNALTLARFYETTVEDLFGHLLEEEDDD